MHHKHLEALAKHLCDAGILCLRFTMKTPNFKYRVKCFAAVVVSRRKIKGFTSTRSFCLFTIGRARERCCNFAWGGGGTCTNLLTIWTVFKKRATKQTFFCLF